VVIIAHRLATVIDADRILVMDAGEAKEYDHPFRLLAVNESDEIITQDGFFASMVKATGETTSLSLFKIAKDNFKRNGNRIY